MAGGFIPREGEHDRVDDVVDVAPRTNLIAFVVNLDGLVLEGANDECVNRTFSDLAGTVDVERTNGTGGQPMLFPVVMGEMLSGELRNGVRPTRFAHGTKARDIRLANAKGIAAEHFARRKIDEPLHSARILGCAERVHRPFEADLHREYGMFEHRIDTRDGCHVNHVLRALRRLFEGGEITYVAHDQLDVGVAVETGVLERISP